MLNGRELYKHRRSFSHGVRLAKYHGTFDSKFWQPQNFSSIKHYGKRISSRSTGFWRRLFGLGEWIRSLIPNFRSRGQRKLDIQLQADKELLALHKDKRAMNSRAATQARRQDQRIK